MKVVTALLLGTGLGLTAAVLLLSPEERLSLLLRMTGKEPQKSSDPSNDVRPLPPIPVPEKISPGYALPVGSVVTIKPIDPELPHGGNVVVFQRFAPTSTLEKFWSYRGKAQSFFPSVVPFIETDVLRVVSRPWSPV